MKGLLQSFLQNVHHTFAHRWTLLTVVCYLTPSTLLLQEEKAEDHLERLFGLALEQGAEDAHALSEEPA